LLLKAADRDAHFIAEGGELALKDLGGGHCLLE
jgi:hypothetical protein